MEGIEDTKKSDSHLTSAAAFVEGGIQDACDDACSICLEAFCDSDPSTVTDCKHEFHLQCILEWCQRSSQCPMCWQPIGLKDPTSHELLEAVERERRIRLAPPRSATIFHHPTLGDFELQHLPVDASDAELEERIIQHLAAAAAMGRRHMARREGQRYRSAGQGRPHFVVFSDQSNSRSTSSASTPQSGDVPIAPSPPLVSNPSGSSHPTSGSHVLPENSSNSRGSSNYEDRAGPSEFQSFSDSIRSKLNAVSMRYKESIAKGTRGWKERLFSRSLTVLDVNSEARRDVNADLTTVSSTMEPLEVKDKDGNNAASVSNRVDSDLHNDMINVGASSAASSNADESS